MAFFIAFIAMVLYEAIGKPLMKARRRRHHYYTLTTKAAYIGDSSFGQRKLDRYALTHATRLRFVAGTPGTIWFATTTETYRRKGRDWTREIPVGFIRIDDAHEVFARIKTITRENG